MKNLITSILLVVCVSMGSVNAQDGIRQAAEKGKSDLLEVLTKTGLDYNFGVNPENLRNSQVASEVAYKEMDFQRLLNFDQQSIDQLLSPVQKYIVPCVQGRNVAATVTVAQNKQGAFQAAELINHRYQFELNQLPAEATSNNFGNITLVYVPNLNTIVYVSGGKSYTTYGGRSLRQATDTQDLLQQMKVDAVAFQQKFGQAAKDGKLLN